MSGVSNKTNWLTATIEINYKILFDGLEILYRSLSLGEVFSSLFHLKNRVIWWFMSLLVPMIQTKSNSFDIFAATIILIGLCSV